MNGASNDSDTVVEVSPIVKWTTVLLAIVLFAQLVFLVRLFAPSRSPESPAGRLPPGGPAQMGSEPPAPPNGRMPLPLADDEPVPPPRASVQPPTPGDARSK